jgi:hypothetical protein
MLSFLAHGKETDTICYSEEKKNGVKKKRKSTPSEITFKCN